ncbi:MAG: cation:proton antiporter [Phenylobacterium sp.]|jgi:Kef-type K+ transport system membrane component KefB|uniref:cation:proton antiporter n=1 Tax=Phenylobacterium sp. TaxID=1871053 RepID=UPI00391BE1A3
MLTEWIVSSVFNEIAALLVLAAGVGFLGLVLRQPLIVSFIAVGILAGPSVLNIARSAEPIDLLAELGIAVLLFLVGVKLDVKLVRTLGMVALATGLGQVIFTSVFGFLICLALGLDPITSLYISVALTFSSTIIIVKLLSDKREIETLHGRIALGFLIVQDIVVVLAMIALSAVGVGARSGAGPGDVLRVMASGFAMLGVVILFVKFAANPLTERLARTPELLIGFAIALAAAFAAVGEGLGFGKELGGLLAGVALASTPFRDTIAARMAPLRDFLLLFFFIALGAQLDLRGLGDSGFAAVVLSLFVLVGNPLIVVLIMAGLGYHRRTGFLAGLTVAQISEFSLIFMAMGVSLGHVSGDSLGLVTLVGLITIAASTYMITYSHQLYRLCEPLLARLKIGERVRAAEGHGAQSDRGPEVVVFGLGRYGGALGRHLAASGRRVFGIDISPHAVRRWRDEGYEGAYGDLSDPEFLTTLPLAQARWVIATMRLRDTGVGHADARIVLIQQLRELGYEGRIAVASTEEAESDFVLESGADLVLTPFADAAERALELINGFEPAPT